MNHHHDLPCTEFLTNLNAYIDGELDQSVCDDIESHIESCPNCKIVVNTLKKTIQLIQVDGQEVHIPEDVRRRLFTRLDLEDYAAKD